MEAQAYTHSRIPLRESAGLTQERLAVMAGTTSATIRFIENGYRPSKETMRNLLDVIGREAAASPAS